MPNWCKGSLKVRGKISDLKEFVQQGLEPVSYRRMSKPDISIVGGSLMINCSNSTLERVKFRASPKSEVFTA